MSVPTAPRASSPSTSRRSVIAAAALAVVALLFAVTAVAVLSHGEPRRAGTNGVAVLGTVPVPAGATICQPGETLASGAAAIELALGAGPGGGPRVVAELSRGGRRIGGGVRAAGWEGTSVRVALADAADADAEGVVACIAVDPSGEDAILFGGPIPPGREPATMNGEAVGGSVRIDYFRAGTESWWSFAPTAFERIAAAHGNDSGGRTLLVVLACVLGACGLAVLVLARTVVRDRPWRATAAAVAAIGVLSAVTWSLITPPFYVPDEITHFAYVQTIGETGRLPVETADPRYSPELRTAMRDAFTSETIAQSRIAAWMPDAARRLERDQDRPLRRTGDGSAKASNPEPPLYYALAAVPYTLAREATLLDRLALVRLLGALLAGVAALFAYLFVREALPGRAWAWSVGALVVAFAPMMGSVSGGANPDALLFPVCAALFYCLARAFRRGLSPRLAVWIGVVLAVGLLGKINFYGLVPGALIAMALAARATTGGWNARTLRLCAIAVAVGFGPYLLMHVADALVWDRANILWRDTSAAPEDRGGLLGQLGYLWQVYLPPLPGQTEAWAGGYIGYEVWFRTWFGAFAASVVFFDGWVYAVGFAVLLLLGGLFLRSGIAGRARLPRRLPELLGYVAMTAGLLLLIGLVAVRGWAPGLDAAAQGRYLLPLMALVAGFVAFAVRGAGDRWGRALGVALVVAAIGWNLFAQLITVEHFYG